MPLYVQKPGDKVYISLENLKQRAVAWIVGDRVEVSLPGIQNPYLGDRKPTRGVIEDILPTLNGVGASAAWVRLDSGELVGVGVDRLTRIG
jgi:hypothetical protein